MKRIRSLMGRRQFLVGAFMGSALGLGYKKVTRAFDLSSQSSGALTSEKSFAAVTQRHFSEKYHHILSPIKIGNVILKNRMIHARSIPPFLQGPEIFPSEQVISYYANVARNGAAVVTCTGAVDLKPRKELGYAGHMPMFDIGDPGVQNYFSQLADAIHFYDAKASAGLILSAPEGYSISNITRTNSYDNAPTGKEIPVELIQKMIEDAATQAKLYQSIGFDMVNIYMSYTGSILSLSLSPDFNKRTDLYGGSLENRARFALEIFQSIKKACGKDFLIEAQISCKEQAGGTLEDVIGYAKFWEDTLDILQIRGGDAFASQMKHPYALPYAQGVKESGAKIITAPNGGFQDLDMNEEYIASGKTDMIAMARTFICDPEYGKKAYEGRGEDVVPCIKCNKCHGTDVLITGPWFNVCSVNPKLDIAHKVDRMIDPPGASKKVAVVGGGPAGMKAAIVAAERGHTVTLYEKNDFMGGQIRYADFFPFKWALKEYKDYLIRQINKIGVQVLTAKATPEMIKMEGYDAVLVAIGAEPIIPDIPGVKGPNVWAPVFVFGNEKSLGKNVVVIGGGQIGTETGMYLAENGHHVTLLAREKSLAADATPILGQLKEAWKALDNFNYITEVTTTAISGGKVNYVDAKGDEKFIQADSVVVSAGRKPRKDEALKFYGSAKRFFAIGDCGEMGGNVQKSMRSAFSAATRI